jgi:hypothetical protein
MTITKNDVTDILAMAELALGKGKLIDNLALAGRSVSFLGKIKNITNDVEFEEGAWEVIGDSNAKAAVLLGTLGFSMSQLGAKL